MKRNGPESPNPNESDAPSQDDAWERWSSFMTDAYHRFQEQLLTIRTLHPGLTPYDLVERAKEARGTVAWWWGAASEIQETINSINSWSVRLHEWNAWNQVIDGYSEEGDKWEVLNHFVEPVAFYCMLQPSSLADRLAVVAESLLHQANQRVSPDEPDRLDQDKRPGRPPRRSDRRNQLNRLGRRWTNYRAFHAALSAMDGEPYQQTTRNFRDLSAHSFAPRFMIGQITRAIRSIGPKSEMVAQSDGTCLLVEHPTEKCVQYAMHAVEPLPLSTAYSANLSEHQKAEVAMTCFATLVGELCERINAIPSRNKDA